MPLEHDIAGKFLPDEQVTNVQPLGTGLINDSFLVSTASGRQAVLQRVNRHVFPHPERIMENLRVLADHVNTRIASRGQVTNSLRLPEVLTTREDEDHVLDAGGGFWRALEYIKDSQTIETIANIRQAEEVGTALGRFHALIHDLDPARLHRTLPGFHDTPGYFARFLRASARPRRASASQELLHALSFAERRGSLTRVLEQARRERKLVTRPIHGDTKLNNFLFDRKTGKAVSLIDLDTVQPGMVHFDIGDCLRSCANPAGESPDDTAAVRLDLDICRVILKNYLAETRKFITRYDFEYIYDAIRLVPFELGLRFLTDHLEGDHYFKTDRAGQNLHRASVQFRLTWEIEENELPLKELVSNLTIG
jgi:Ser/Thr protein kinase RdoA (MazF antagonist)